MSTYRKEWTCCGSVSETEGYEPEQCPFCSFNFDAEAVGWAYGKCVALGLENGSIESAMMMDRLKLMLS